MLPSITPPSIAADRSGPRRRQRQSPPRGRGGLRNSGIEHVRQLPRLVVEVLWALGEELADDGEELGRVHGSTHPLPRTCSRAILSDMPSRTSLRIRCSCSTVADSPGSRSEESGLSFTPFT